MEEMEKRGPGRPPKIADDIRPDMRKEMRAESPAEAAKRRAAEIRENTADLGLDGDKFYIPEAMKQDGWAYVWKVHESINQTQHSRINETLRLGWDYCRQEDFPGYPVEMDGLRLMMIPTEIYIAREKQSEIMAKRQVRIKEDQLRGGGAVENLADGFDRSNRGDAIGKGLKKSYSPMQVPS